MKAWLAHHVHSFRTALQRFLDTPLATLFTVLVIGIAIALPAGFYLLLDNIRQAAGSRAPQSEISIFLQLDISTDNGRQFAAQLAQRPDVAAARFISREAALEQLRQTGLGDIVAGLPENPLPHAVVVTPKSTEVAALETLAGELRQKPDVDHVSVDSEWARRLDALLNLGQHIAWILAGVLGLAMAAITGNTIRLQIYAQRDEIEVARLIGATDRFIRRPFLYFGGLQGLCGGLMAWGLLTLALHFTQDNVSKLAAAYGSAFQLSGLSPEQGGLLLAAATLLGLIGAFFAVAHTQRSLNIR